MNIRYLVSKAFAYLVLLAIAASFFLAFVTVPFHGPDTEDQKDKIRMDQVSFPGKYSLNGGYVDIADKNGIKDPQGLINYHIAETKRISDGYINYTYESEEYSVHWSEEGIILDDPSNELFITRDIIQTRSGRDTSNIATKLQNRYFNSYRFGYTVQNYLNIEDSMVNAIRNYNYTAVEAWESKRDTYIRYQADQDSVESEFIVAESGVIKTFTHKGDTQFNYVSRTGDSAPPFFKPSWLVGD